MSTDRNVFIVPNDSKYALERALRSLEKYFLSVVKQDLYFHSIAEKRERVKWKAARARKRLKKQQAKQAQRQAQAIHDRSHRKDATMIRMKHE